MVLCVFLKGRFEFDVFPVRRVLGHEGRPLLLIKLKRKSDLGLRGSGAPVRGAHLGGFEESHCVGLIEAPRPHQFP